MRSLIIKREKGGSTERREKEKVSLGRLEDRSPKKSGGKRDELHAREETACSRSQEKVPGKGGARGKKEVGKKGRAGFPGKSGQCTNKGLKKNRKVEVLPGGFGI